MTPTDRRLLAGSLLALALSTAAFAGAALWLAARHMAGIAALCGPQTPHCGWCQAAVGAALTALLAVVGAARLLQAPAPAPLQAN